MVVACSSLLGAIEFDQILLLHFVFVLLRFDQIQRHVSRWQDLRSEPECIEESQIWYICMSRTHKVVLFLLVGGCKPSDL